MWLLNDFTKHNNSVKLLLQDVYYITLRPRYPAADYLNLKNDQMTSLTRYVPESLVGYRGLSIQGWPDEFKT